MQAESIECYTYSLYTEHPVERIWYLKKSNKLIEKMCPF
jgi:hypothetical protein